jgi:hypothetical protein
MPKRKKIGHKASGERQNSFIKKSIITLLGIGVLLYPLICFSSYIIHLKDGREVITDQYWEEADQIKVKQYGGVIGIQKNLINDIEDVGDLPEKKKKVVVRKAIETAGKVEAEKEKAAEAEEKVKEGKEEVPEKAAKDQGAKRKKEQEKLVNKYLEEFDLYKTKFKTVDIMTKEELNNFYIELNIFKKAVLTKRLGGFFANHLREVYSMQERIQENMNWISKTTN